MRKSTRFLSALAVAGMIAASGSAFTAASTGLNDGEFVGYDSATVSGVTVTNVAYNTNATDASKMESIVFTETENVSLGHKAILTTKTAAGVATTTDCSAPTYQTTSGTISCPTTVNVVDVVSVSLTVTAT